MTEKEKKKDLPGPAEAPVNASLRNPHYPWLTAVPSISLLGDHDGILDDDMFDLLNEEVERKEQAKGDPS